MEQREAEALAKTEMVKWKLLERGWKFQWIYTNRVFGRCAYSRKLIKLSYYLVGLNPHEQVLDTIRHEIAHALTGKREGHSHVWKAACRTVGCKPEIYYPRAVVKPKHLYEWVCPVCEAVFKKWYAYPYSLKKKYHHRTCNTKERKAYLEVRQV